MELKEAGGRRRPICSQCRFAHFGTFFVAAGGAVINDGRVLLARKAQEPALGKWTLPGGFVEEDELLEDAVVREVREETGVAAAVERLVAVRSTVAARGHDTYIVFALAYLGGEPRADGVEIAEVAWFDLDRLTADADVAAYTVTVATAALGSKDAGLVRRPYVRATGEPADFFVVPEAP